MSNIIVNPKCCTKSETIDNTNMANSMADAGLCYSGEKYWHIECLREKNIIPTYTKYDIEVE